MMNLSLVRRIRRKAVWGARATLAGLSLAMILASSFTAFAEGDHRQKGQAVKNGRPNHFVRDYRLDDELDNRSKNAKNGVSSVIVELKSGKTLPPEFANFVRKNTDLSLIHGIVLDLPNGLLQKLASKDEIFRVHHNRPIATHNYRTSVTVGATAVRDLLGYTGTGIGIAIIDSGIATWHDDLTNN